MSTLILAALLATAPETQDADWAVALTTGELIEAQGVRFDGARVVLELGGQQRRELPRDQLLAVHGRPAVAGEPVEVHLVGGDRYYGRLLGGDRAGESLRLRSAAFGEVALALDRVAVVIFRDRAGTAGPRDFVLADGDEAWFRPARRGFDSVVGTIHRFDGDGLSFAAGAGGPRTVEYARISAVAIRGGYPREGDPGALLTTRGGDVVGVEVIGGDTRRLELELEGGVRVRLAGEAIGSLTLLDAGRRFLSDLVPLRVEESSFFADGGEPLLRHVADRAVSGDPLAAGGRAYGKGLGVHSRSLLAYEVPEGVAAFSAVVGFDDSVLALPARADVAVRIRVSGREVWSVESMQSGTPPRSVGRIPVAPGDLVELEVDYGAGLDIGDRIDWLNAVFLP